MFKKFKDAGVLDYLNKNSLNQAGYEVKIENFAQMDNADVDDYFYAFDKADWTTKKYYTEDFNKKRKKWEYVKKADGTYEMEADGITYKKILTEYNEITDVITEDEEIDNIVFELYQQKLKTKTKSYDGGVIILTEYEAPTQTSAFSRTSPLSHYKLFVFSTSVERKEDYAHEIGHMLGLPHSFFTEKEKESYKISRENISGNNEPEYITKEGRRDKNEKYISGINKQIQIAETKDTYYDMSNPFYSDKESLTKYLNNFIAFYQGKLKTVNYTETAKNSINSGITRNQNALRKLSAVTDCKYKVYDLDCYFLKDDYVKYLKRKKKYLKDILIQLESSVLFYRQDTTKNFMDYFNTRVFFTNNQIKIMRDDSKNFIEEICKCKLHIKNK